MRRPSGSEGDLRSVVPAGSETRAEQGSETRAEQGPARRFTPSISRRDAGAAGNAPGAGYTNAGLAEGHSQSASPSSPSPRRPECVRPYFIKRVCVFGPESTGKSTLARDLAVRFDTVYVAEFARGLLDPKQGVCHASDIPLIARGQAAAEDALARRANKVLFCDTDLLLTTIWSDVLFGDCPTWIRTTAQQRQYDLYLLLDVDVPWVDDQQRYLPYARQEFFDRCRQALESHQRTFVVIHGNWTERFEQACRQVQQLLD